MQTIQLFINDQLVDLSDDNPIALNFQINNLAEVKNQQGNTSNQFKLPLTQNNRQILGFPDDIQITTNLPYTVYNCKLIQDGIEIIPYGIGELMGSDQSTADFKALSGNVDFFDNIDNKIYDMGDGTSIVGKNYFKPYDHIWNIQNIINSQTNTEGYIWPLVDYGQYTEVPDQIIDIRKMRPGFFLKTAIDLICQSAGTNLAKGEVLQGYKATGFLINDPLYQKLIVQFANDQFEHGTEFQKKINSLNAKCVKSQPQQIPTNETNHLITFNQITGSSFSNNEYTASEIMKVKVVLKYSGEYRDSYSGGSSPDLHMQIQKYTAGAWAVVENGDSPQTTTGDFTTISFTDGLVEADVDLAIGDKIRVFAITGPATYRGYGSILNASVSFTYVQQDMLPGQMVQCERIFPDITQKELLKDTLQRFGIICQTNNSTKTINFASFRDIVNNMPIAKKWTDKCLDQGKQIVYQLGGYSQANFMNLKHDDAVGTAFGRTQININDKTLPLYGDLFTSVFAGTLNRPYTYGGTIAKINKVEANSIDGKYTISTEPRILIDQKLDLLPTGKHIDFTDNGLTKSPHNGQISIPYFAKSSGAYSLMPEDLRLSYYPELEVILKQAKKVTRYFLLTPLDILELDLLIPVLLEQDGCYYYINKIDSWIKGRPCKVELIRLYGN